MLKNKDSRSLVLVFPRFKYASGDFSLGLAYLGGYIKEKVKNIEVNLLDTSFNPNLKYVKAYFKKTKPDIIGIYADTLMFRDAIKIAEIAKGFNANVIIGGPHATVEPSSVIQENCVDAICIGESELTLEEYVNTFFAKEEFDNIKGIWFKKGRRVVENPRREPIENLDILPHPDRSLFNVEKYLNIFFQLDSYNSDLRGISLIASRGCQFMCSFCQPILKSIFGSKVRIRTPRNVITELKLLKEKYKIDAFYLQDENITAFKQWIGNFCNLLRQEGLNLIWACGTRADTIDFETLKTMNDSGLVKIKVGIETITDRIRNGIYKKGITMQQIEAVMKNAKKLGVQVAGLFMLGGPTETRKEIWDTINFAANSDLIEAYFSITTPLPGTELFNYLRRLKISKKEISTGELKVYKIIAYLYFYLHPKRIAVMLKSMRSVKGLKKLLLKLKRI